MPRDDLHLKESWMRLEPKPTSSRRLRGLAAKAVNDGAARERHPDAVNRRERARSPLPAVVSHARWRDRMVERQISAEARMSEEQAARATRGDGARRLRRLNTKPAAEKHDPAPCPPGPSDASQDEGYHHPG